MTDFQALFNTISTAARDTRKNYHMTIDKLCEVVAALPDSTIPVVFDYGTDLSVQGVNSYRGYYEDLALEPGEQRCTAGQLRVLLKQAHGAEFTGYKGGDFVMEGDTPLWTASYGNTGRAIIDAKVIDGRLVLITKNVD